MDLDAEEPKILKKLYGISGIEPYNSRWKTADEKCKARDILKCLKTMKMKPFMTK